METVAPAYITDYGGLETVSIDLIYTPLTLFGRGTLSRPVVETFKFP
jgi:hypothetical protein